MTRKVLPANFVTSFEWSTVGELFEERTRRAASYLLATQKGQDRNYHANDSQHKANDSYEYSTMISLLFSQGGKARRNDRSLEHNVM